MKERKILGGWLADKINSINSYYDGYPIYPSPVPILRPFPFSSSPVQTSDPTNVVHRCKQKVDACDWMMCGTMRHWVHRCRLDVWAASTGSVHYTTVDQLGKDLLQIKFPKYSTSSYNNHECIPLDMSQDRVVADIKQKLDSLKGLDLADLPR